jgi:hypothetical protein
MPQHIYTKGHAGRPSGFEWKDTKMHNVTQNAESETSGKQSLDHGD